MSDPTSATTEATDASVDTTSQAQVEQRVYTQEEFDRHMAGLKASIAKKYEKTFAELGDIDELRQLKTQSEARRLEEAKKRGDFEKVLQEMAETKNAEIAKRDRVIQEYRVDVPLVNAAAQYRSVNPEQVKSLLKTQVRLNGDGEVEVVDSNGQVRYGDSGRPLGVPDLVREFLEANPHFVQPTPATTTGRSSIANTGDQVDLSKLDMRLAEHRKIYAEARAQKKL